MSLLDFHSTLETDDLPLLSTNNREREISAHSAAIFMSFQLYFVLP